jgi:D-threo-aldose 1-dehydrogenase
MVRKICEPCQMGAARVDPTERVPLGRTGLSVTRLGLGLAPIGGLFTPVGDAQAAATVARAWDRGLRLFDTAPLYGYGLSERRTGAALSTRELGEFVLATKVGRVLEPGGTDTQDFWPEATPGIAPRFDFSADGITRSLATSLDRLGLDRVDIVHVHDPDQHYDQALRHAIPALVELRKEGRIGAVSIGMNQAPMLARFVKEADGLECVLVAGRYTLLDRSAADELLPLCAERGIAVLAAGVYNSGLLADPTAAAKYDYLPVSRERLEQARAIQLRCARYKTPLRAAAIQFAARHPAVTAVVVGVRSPDEVDDCVDMFARPVPDELWAEL